MIDFPSSPVIGQTYTYNGRTWTWDGTSWARVVNAGQVVSVFVTPGVEVISSASALPTIDNDWSSLTYV